MRVINALKKDVPALSFEFFPPKTQEQEEHLFAVLSELSRLHPDYVSVTYGALGNSSERSFRWVEKIKHKFKIESVAHLTCVGEGREEIKGKLRELREMGVENILSLRGDPPVDDVSFLRPKDGLLFAKDLVVLVKQEIPGACLGVAGYPEKHPEAKTLEEDIQHLKAKVDAGADYIVTQLFFDNQHYFSFVEKCHAAGINIPIVPGIMPITSYKQIKKMTSICGAKIPPKLLARLDINQQDPEAIREIGFEQAVLQCQELKAQHVPGLHFFVMNQSGPIKRILKEIKFSHPQ